MSLIFLFDDGKSQTNLLISINTDNLQSTCCKRKCDTHSDYIPDLSLIGMFLYELSVFRLYIPKISRLRNRHKNTIQHFHEYVVSVRFFFFQSSVFVSVSSTVAMTVGAGDGVLGGVGVVAVV